MWWQDVLILPGHLQPAYEDWLHAVQQVSSQHAWARLGRHELRTCLREDGCHFMYTSQDTMWEEWVAILVDEWLDLVVFLSEELGYPPPKLQVEAYEFWTLRDAQLELVDGRPLDWIMYACEGFPREAVTMVLQHPRPLSMSYLGDDDWLEWSFVMAFCDELAGTIIVEPGNEVTYVPYDLLIE